LQVFSAESRIPHNRASFSIDFTSTLALLQHLQAIDAFAGPDRLYFVFGKLKMFLEVKRLVAYTG